MSLGHGAKIITNGLVFAYDMGPNPGVNKSWKGKPTTNLYADGDYSTQTLHPVRNGPWSFPAGITDPYGNQVLRIDQDGTTSYHGRDIAVTVGETYTSSAWIYASPDSNTTALRLVGEQGFAPDAAYDLSKKGTWQRVSITGTATTTNARILAYQLSNMTTGYCLFGSIQFEQGSFATPFVNGTRSNTEALLDWTGNNTISPVDLEYTNNNIFRFNGLGERDGSPLGSYIPLPADVTTTLPSSKPDGVTYDIWLKADTDAPDRMGLFVGSSTINHIEIRSSTKNFRTEAVTQNGYSFGAGGFPDSCRGVWSNFTIVFANNETNRPVRWYQNGKLFHTHANMGSGSDVNQYFLPTKLGSATGSAAYLYAESFKGEISALKIYDRSLTENEIKQNFSAFRGRHGL